MTARDGKPFPQPIQTSYNGYRFRSRLEARWAVFFDALGLRYEYEAQGFYLKGVGGYLPDFMVEIPKFNQWFFMEVKPSAFVSEGDGDKILNLALQYPMLVATGSPWYDTRTSGLVMSLPTSPDMGFVIRPVASFAVCPHCDKVYVAHFGLDGWGYSQGKFLTPPWIMRQETECDRLVFAYNAARSARFEHGERPQGLS